MARTGGSASGQRFAEHHRLAVATSLLQIAIVLETLAAGLDSGALFAGGLAVGVLGVLAVSNGLVGIV